LNNFQNILTINKYLSKKSILKNKLLIFFLLGMKYESMLNIKKNEKVNDYIMLKIHKFITLRYKVLNWS